MKEAICQSLTRIVLLLSLCAIVFALPAYADLEEKRPGLRSDLPRPEQQIGVSSAPNRSCPLDGITSENLLQEAEVSLQTEEFFQSTGRVTYTQTNVTMNALDTIGVVRPQGAGGAEMFLSVLVEGYQLDGAGSVRIVKTSNPTTPILTSTACANPGPKGLPGCWGRIWIASEDGNAFKNPGTGCYRLVVDGLPQQLVFPFEVTAARDLGEGYEPGGGGLP